MLQKLFRNFTLFSHDYEDVFFASSENSYSIMGVSAGRSGTFLATMETRSHVAMETRSSVIVIYFTGGCAHAPVAKATAGRHVQGAGVDQVCRSRDT